MGQARLGDWRFDIDPSSISWGVNASLADNKGIGGKVVQVLGVHYSDLTFQTVFTTHEEQADFLHYMKYAIRGDLAEESPEHMRFLYPPRGIDFTVAIMSLKQASRSVQWTPDTLPRPLTLTAKIIGDATGLTTRMDHALIDEYINRFAEDFGWKKTSYNGPLSSEQVAEYNIGVSTREPLSGADQVLLNYAQQGLDTPTPGNSPTVANTFQ